MAEIVMPRLSDTMEEGTILRWLKRDGEEVKRGEELVEIETDKANMTYESDQEGVLETIAAEGDTLAVGEPIARVGASTGTAGEDTAAASPPASEQEGEPASRPAGVRAVGDAAEGGDSHGAGSSTRRSEAEASPAGERVRASPLARRIASESGVDLHAVSGSGPGGRIVKADVQAAGGERTPRVGSPTEDGSTARDGNPTTATDATAADPGSPAEPTSAAGSMTAGAATAKGETTIVELTRTQQTIARRMAESKATIPDFTLQMDVDMEECVKLREELKRLSPEEAPTYNDMVVKACALALREHPRANGSYRDGRMQLHSRINVGVAVAVDSGDGPAAGALVVPTVFDADEKSLGEIARETRALAERVRDGTITPPELGGGTFTVSNLGMFGVSTFTAIVNPPQAAILSVGALAPRAVVREGEVVARSTMTVTLACDHRILYGADAARFLARVRELLEAPAALTL
jgi:pyruvate dehydrogenase E2 component (dihydrolipoamide acetyltransferase)